MEKVKSEGRSPTVVVITTEQKVEFLACFKLAGSLAARVAVCFLAIYNATFEESDSDNTYAVAGVVVAQLKVLALDAGYQESTVNRVLHECLTANGLVKPTASKRTGRKVEVISDRCYKAAAAVIEAESGRGVVPGKKFLTNTAKLLVRFANEEITLAELKAYRAPVPVKTTAEVEAGKIVKMPAPAPALKKAA
ncbi:MAG: hypothetical protein ABSA97_14180 [Verrucomicrobiia bacterium]